MRALFDVNVLIALLDGNHVMHGTATDWLGRNAQAGWASCPLTQNGCVRVLTTPSYRHCLAVPTVAARLAEACAHSLHEFWPDDVSILDTERVDSSHVHGPRQLTDIYLLALAVAHGGRLVTFDTAIAREAVLDARPHHLLTL
jgi:toxin-antitoxin system PIN domain toxin